MPKAVEVDRLTKRFGRFVAVNQISFEVAPGEIFGFLGSNGAGKTTAIRVLCGLLPTSGGVAQVLGIDVARDPDGVKRRIGYMSQRFSLYEDLTPLENITFFGGIYGLSGRQLVSRRDWAVEMAELAGHEKVLTGDLAGGYRQRLALACALLHEPRVVFLDEPTGGVDPLSRRRFWEIIDQLSAAGTTVFVTTHYLDEAERCHRLALMHAGNLLALGDLRRLRSIFSGRTVLEIRSGQPMETLKLLEAQPELEEVSAFGSALHAVVREEQGVEARLQTQFQKSGIEPYSMRKILPSLEDVFIRYIRTSSRGEQS